MFWFIENISTRPQRFFSNSKNPQNWPLIDAQIWASKLLIFSHNLDSSIKMTFCIWLFECKLGWVHFSACKVHNKVFFRLNRCKTNIMLCRITFAIVLIRNLITEFIHIQHCIQRELLIITLCWSKTTNFQNVTVWVTHRS